MFIKSALAAITAMLALSPVASYAIPIAAGSQIDITGGVAPIGGTSVFDPNTKGLDFLYRGNLNSVDGTNSGTISLNSNSTGSFATAFTLAGCTANPNNGGCGIIKDIPSFSPFAAIPGFYTITENGQTLTFDLNTLPTVNRFSAGGTGSLTIVGTGTFHLAGFDDTPGTFVLTSQASGTTTFSASTMGTAVDEPASIMVLGAGLLLGGIVMRRRQQM